MRQKHQSKENTRAVSPVIGVILMVAITVILAAVIGTFVLGLGDNVQETPTAAIESDQDQTQFALTIVSAGNIDSAQLTSPNGVRSTVLSEGLEAGAKLTVRSNATVYTFVDNNNVSILDAGTESPVYLNSPNEINTKAPTNLVLQDVDAAGPAASEYTEEAAYLACLYNHGGFEVGGTQIPASLSIPCHSPVLAQDDTVSAGTTTSPGVTVPILLEEGTYRLLGRLNGNEAVIQNIEFERR